MSEFLPLCDLLFNVVSLAAYFCDIVFDILVVYALYNKGSILIVAQCLIVILLTSLITQIVSAYWYLKGKPDGWKQYAIVTLHILQFGVVWRYARLLAPVQLENAAPMLLIQLSLLVVGESGELTDLVTVSAALSLFSVCWALASFSKHVQKVEKLVLTWLGVLSQLLWRAGTVTARALALSAYAHSYHSWIFLVLALHWACMFLWLVSPRSAFYGEKGKRLGICVLVAGVYVLAYINLQDKPHGRTMAVFYGVMLLENCLLVTACLAAIWSVKPPNWLLLPALTIFLFFGGLLFMLIYYRFFHVRRIMDNKPSHPPGVFNCRFAGPTAAALYRKKKKPTSFVPPPGLTPMAVPFWRRPLPSSSENEGSSVGSRVNIHQKLQEKKQKQLAELKIIEEEIKQGKLVGPECTDPDDRQPIPRIKRHLEPQLLSLASLNNLASYGVNLNRRPPPRAPRSRTPELLLAPRYLYCDCSIPEPEPVELPGQPNSDIESQISLPRSYTLPREFKYYRRGRTRKPIRTIASTNSSDGDVDSADDESDHNSPPALVKPLRKQYRHETKL
ncbi:PREDICTED: uncharacterized protein LOC108559026 isoform X2 [Nicrophorus vespilloides]|uniref:XK-related protein n=1 Tax=Nicrophorus vespilloides TaxID=110193 RepID=A0ABM1MAP5_NICVS|nr:PREDICTED: uncharacterized protein LOC108559026 isoform X2 [Nicrophorus vespilloides]